MLTSNRRVVLTCLFSTCILALFFIVESTVNSKNVYVKSCGKERKLTGKSNKNTDKNKGKKISLSYKKNNVNALIPKTNSHAEDKNSQLKIQLRESVYQVLNTIWGENNIIYNLFINSHRVTKRKANPLGQIFVLEYHRITPKEGLYARSISNFKRDLERLYALGFRPVTISEYLDGKMNIPPGSSPVIITFDDSSESQFRIMDDGTIDPNSGIGIMDAFAKKHPDFPVKAVFYILPYIPFGQKKWVQKKLNLFKKWGVEVGSHTMSHKNLSKMTDEQVKWEFATSVDWMKRLGFNPRTIAVPFGVMPKNRSLLNGFFNNGKFYRFEANFRSMGRPGNPLGSSKPDYLLNFPRVIGSDDHLCLKYYLDLVEKGKVKPYVMP